MTQGLTGTQWVFIEPMSRAGLSSLRPRLSFISSPDFSGACSSMTKS